VGDAGEWAAALGTSAAVLVSAWTIREDWREKREDAALKVVPSQGPVGGPPDTTGMPTTEMLVQVANNSTRAVRQVLVEVFHGIEVRWSEQWEEVPALTATNKQRPPSRMSGRRGRARSSTGWCGPRSRTLTASGGYGTPRVGFGG
jgi:hypothetical protein